MQDLGARVEVCFSDVAQCLLPPLPLVFTCDVDASFGGYNPSGWKFGMYEPRIRATVQRARRPSPRQASSRQHVLVTTPLATPSDTQSA